MNGWMGMDGNCWVEKQTNKQSTGLDWTTGEWMMMLDCAWGSWRGMSQRKGEEGEGERGEGEGKGEGEKKCRRKTM